MPDLERDLGLFATVTISVGAMIGSGIFVLPGLASKIAGPAVILAYLLAGLLVLPAALSKAEMGTAMPEAGGTYLYIDRAMGPLPGTIAGIGAWFSLVFKSAFALVGLGAYLLLFVPVDQGLLTVVGLGLAGLLVVVNVVGVKQTGRLQAVIVSLVVLSLFVFVGDGITYVEQARYHPFFPTGGGGLLAATGFVFVSYAGVTKIASVAEEVERPGRNIPIGILASIVVMMVLYTLVVFVVVGVAPAPALAESLTPMALAAEAIGGTVGRVALAVVAVLALTSMANAGILSASRFPLAMSRDSLAPASLGVVHERFKTPFRSIAFTGVLLAVLIAFVPVIELAKLASAFQILVFAFENAAVVAFREADLAWYDPEFTAPGYPWVQLVGILGGGVLLTQMGALPMLGAVGLVAVGVLWYQVYGRERTEREGAALDAIRSSSAERALAETRRRAERTEPIDVLVPLGRKPTDETRADFDAMFRLAADVVDPSGGTVHVVRFEEVPSQLDLEAASEGVADEAMTDRDRLGATVDVDVECGTVVTHDAKRSVANVVADHDIDLVLGEWHVSRWHAELLGTDMDWYMDHLPSDVVFVRNRGYEDVDRVVVVAGQGPFDPLEPIVADAIAGATDATVEFVTVLDRPTDDHRDIAEAYLEELAAVCSADTETVVLDADDTIEGVAERIGPDDLTIVGTEAHHLLVDVLFGTVPDRLVERVASTVLITHAARSRSHTFIRVVLDRYVF